MIDINLAQGDPTINEELKLITQQIDMLFDTANREVFGDPHYGTNYDEFLFNLNLSNSAMEYQVRCDLANIELFGYEPSVEVGIVEGTLNDIILIKIGLEKNNTYYEKTYKIQ